MQSGEVIRLRYKKTMEKEREGRETDAGFYRLFMIIFDYIVVHGVWAERRGGGPKSQWKQWIMCPFCPRIPRPKWILSSHLQKPLNHRRVNNHKITKAEAKSLMVAYESILISWIISRGTKSLSGKHLWKGHLLKRQMTGEDPET